jgi:hypothetical protein
MTLIGPVAARSFACAPRLNVPNTYEREVVSKCRPAL